jgi:hypothetical protein
VNLQRINYTYNKFNNIIEVLNEKWDGSKWVYNTLDNTVYSNENRYLGRISKIWSNSQWYNNSKDSAYYNDKGKMIGRIFFRQLNQEWIYDYKYSYTLSNDNITKLLIEKWNYLDSTWSNYNNYIYTYDERNNEIEALNEFWQYDHWENNIKTSSKYDEENRLTQYFKIRWQNDGWINDIKFDYDYSQPTSISDDKCGFEFSDICYPNPCSNYIIYSFITTGLTWMEVSVLDMRGNFKLQIYNGIIESGTHNIKVKTDELTSGTYLLFIKSNGQIHSILFVVEK